MNITPDPIAATDHLEPRTWAQVNRRLVRKAIAEFSHEQLLAPEDKGPAGRPGWRRWVLEVGAGVEYRFDARPMALRHWNIDAASIGCFEHDSPREPDALQFVLHVRDALGMRAELLPVYLEEISSTLSGAAYKRLNPRARSSEELADADFQDFEQAMTEGHPAFVANNGRLGFDAADYRAYAPEAGGRFALVWLAVRRQRAHFASVCGLDHERLMREELGPRRLAEFDDALRRRGLSAADYWYMPAHPWQWFEKLAISFAAHIARQDIVCLGSGEDHYQPQQSIRTYFNVDHPERRYVKTSLSILNMGFMRGLSPHYMAGTPAINEWVHALVDGDATLRGHGFAILREVATIGFTHACLEAATDSRSAYRKMLSCLWRESPLPHLRPGERLMTMAALLHVDRDGVALLPVLIRRSGLDVDEWLARYLRAYLAPLLHCFYAHDLVFMPHGENLLLVMADHAPVRCLMKDIAEEASILDPHAVLPGLVQRLVVDVPEECRLLAVFIDVFDGLFRFMSEILVEHGACRDEDAFWRLVAGCVADYQRGHPQYQDKFAAYDLFAPTFVHSCLNRLQLADNRQMVDLANPAQTFQTADDLDNPIAKFRPGPVKAASCEGSSRPPRRG